MSSIIKIINTVRFSTTVVGLAGNVISFAVFSRKSFATNSINVYCRALALSDILVLTLQIVSDTASVFYDTNIYWTSNALCKFSVYGSEIFSGNSSWILVAFAIDKVLCMLNTTRYKLELGLSSCFNLYLHKIKLN